MSEGFPFPLSVQTMIDTVVSQLIVRPKRRRTVDRLERLNSTHLALGHSKWPGNVKAEGSLRQRSILWGKGAEVICLRVWGQSK